MKIIRPLTNIVSQKVKSWKEISNEALQLKEYIEAKNFDGNWKEAYALAHVQVNMENPKTFFVVEKGMEKKFGSWCVVNLKILSKRVPCQFSEGCMSFMHRNVKKVDRHAKIMVYYKVPKFGILWPKIKAFRNLPAFICQHEADHFVGKNIYGL